MAETAVSLRVKRLTIARLCRLNNFDNDSNFNANDWNVDNENNWLRGIAHAETFTMIRDLWQELCSYDNLLLAYQKARKHKTLKLYVIKFEKNLRENLLQLRSDLIFHSYRPKPLVNFIIRDPKTRKISKSNFRDRIVHHSLCNIIEPIFEKIFIYDSYANRKNKGTLKAIERFDFFKKKNKFVLKADIKHYFDNISHNILVNTIKNKIKDTKIIWLTNLILKNSTGGGAYGKRNASRQPYFAVLRKCLS